MAHIKEPKGIDFIIKSEPLTDTERKAISEFIRLDKAKNASKQIIKKKTIAAKKKQFV